jgi:NET1-associated nuclear protein 1 (U3 small nucleolar RNA-associated protein 17)
MQILTASMDGTVKIWDWVEGRLIRTIDIAQDGHVHHLCVGQVAGVWTIFAAASVVKPGRKAQKDGE